MRKTALVEGEFYHIYNRGVDKRSIFVDDQDVRRFLQSMTEFNVREPVGSLFENSFRLRQLGGSTAKLDDKPLVRLICYCLNPNHYHFILEALTDNGIPEFMKRLSGGYTWYFNNRHKRTGSLFQGRYKAIHVNNNEYLLHLSAYVNLNNEVHQLGGSTAKLVKNSFTEYEHNAPGFCEKDIILEQFRSRKEYSRFARSTVREIYKKRKEDKELERLLLE